MGEAGCVVGVDVGKSDSMPWGTRGLALACRHSVYLRAEPFLPLQVHDPFGMQERWLNSQALVKFQATGSILPQLSRCVRQVGERLNCSLRG